MFRGGRTLPRAWPPRSPQSGRVGMMCSMVFFWGGQGKRGGVYSTVFLFLICGRVRCRNVRRVALLCSWSVVGALCHPPVVPTRAVGRCVSRRHANEINECVHEHTSSCGAAPPPPRTQTHTPRGRRSPPPPPHFPSGGANAAGGTSQPRRRGDARGVRRLRRRGRQGRRNGAVIGADHAQKHILERRA